MASLTVPDRYVSGLAKIISLPQTQTDELVGFFSVVAPSGSVESIVATAASKIDSLKLRDIKEIVETLISLGEAREGLAYSTEEFVEEIFSAMLRSGRKELVVPDERLGQFKDGLKKFLDLPSIRTFSKVTSLTTDYEHVFCKARVLTDVRPVFESDPDAAPTAVLITHTLRLAYHDVEGLKEIYVSFQEHEIGSLLAALERAEAKAKALRNSILERAKVPVIDVD